MSQRQTRAERRATKHRWGFVFIPTCSAIVAAEVVFAISAIVPPVLAHRVKQRQALADAVASLGGTKAVSCDFSVQYGDVVTLVLDASDVGALGDVSPKLIGIPIPPCVLLLLHQSRLLCYRWAAVVTGCQSGACVMEGRSWTISRGFAVRIPSAPTTGNAGAKTSRCAVAMDRTNSGGCSAAEPARHGFLNGRGRRCSARPCRRRKSARSWSTSPKVAASGKRAAWWASIGTR